MTMLFRLWLVSLVIFIGACDQMKSPSGSATATLPPAKQEATSAAPARVAPVITVAPPVISEVPVPAQKPIDQARAFTQSTVDRVLGGDQVAFEKAFPVLRIKFIQGRLTKLVITSFVPAYSAEGKALENQFKASFEAEGTDYLGRPVPAEVFSQDVTLKNGKWSMSLFTED